MPRARSTQTTVAAPGDARPRVSKTLRFQIFRRDNFGCRYCGRTAPEWPMRIDHVMPVALGGTNDPGNLVTACQDCNAGKAATPPDASIVADVDQDALRWASAMKRAAEIQRGTADAERARGNAFTAYWETYKTSSGCSVPVDLNWRVSIAAFCNAGLESGDLVDAVDVAMAATKVDLSSRWRYFCGVCWKKVEQRQAMAAEIIAEEDYAIALFTDEAPAGDSL